MRKCCITGQFIVGIRPARSTGLHNNGVRLHIPIYTYAYKLYVFCFVLSETIKIIYIYIYIICVLKN